VAKQAGTVNTDSAGMMLTTALDRLSNREANPVNERIVEDGKL
jgi:hypothetical protein